MKMRVVVTGFLAVTFVVILLHALRWTCDRVILAPNVVRHEVDLTPAYSETKAPGKVTLVTQPSRWLLDPVLASHSFDRGEEDAPVLAQLPGSEGEGRTPYRTVWYNRELGLMEYDRISKDGSLWRREPVAFAGPGGIGAKPEAKLGRFHEPLFGNLGGVCVLAYDKGRRQLFKIDFDRSVFLPGPADFGRGHQPIQLVTLEKNPALIDVKLEVQNRSDVRSATVLILDESYDIRRLDTSTMAFVGPAATLWHHSDLGDIVAYRIGFLPSAADHRYAGLFYLGIPRGFSNLFLVVYDPAGKIVLNDNFGLRPGGGGTSFARFAVESLHPPILSVATYVVSRYTRSDRDLSSFFLIPDSSIGEAGRFRQRWRFVLPAIVCWLPSLIVSSLLAWRVQRDVAAAGLPHRERRFWMVSTVALGLAGYITWRLVRPSIAMVTCPECGKLRRPDLATCQHCRSPWVSQDAIAPRWQVHDREAAGKSPSPVQAAPRVVS